MTIDPLEFAARVRPLYLYRPLRWAVPLHVSTARLRFVRKPNQVGGTDALAVEVWWAATDSHPFRPPIGDGPIVIMIKDLDAGYGDFCERLWARGVRDAIHEKTRYKPGEGFYTGNRRLLRLKNGRRIEFRSGTQNVMALESFTAAAGFIDEPPTERHFRAFMRGMSANQAPVLMQFTPVNAGDLSWLRLQIEGDTEHGTPPAEDWLQVVPQLTVEDCTTIDGTIIRSQDSIDAQVASMSPWEEQQRRYGAWEGDTASRRFVAFTPAHLTDDHSHYPDGMVFRLGLDHGEGDGKQVTYLVGYDEEARRYYVLAEWRSKGVATPIDVAEGIRDLLDDCGLTPHHVDACFGDINSSGFLGEGRQYNRHIEDAIATAYGARVSPISVLTPDKRKGSVNAGETALHHAFREDRMRVHEQCKGLTHALKHYTGPKDRDLKDPIDALRYAVHDLLLASTQATPRIRIG